MGIRCWWFGCEAHPQDPAPVEYLDCQHCGERMNYESLAGITRWNEFKSLCAWFFFRRWFPERCEDCGKRYGKHDGCLPF